MLWDHNLIQRQRRRLAAWFTLLLVGVLVGFGWIAYRALLDTLEAQTDAANDHASAALLSVVHWQSATPIIDRKQFDHEVEEMALAHGLVAAQIHDGQGRLLHRHLTEPRLFDLSEPARRTVSGPRPLRILQRTVPSHGPARLTVLVGTDWHVAEQALHHAIRQLVLAIGIGSAAAACLAYGLASILMRPIQRAFEQQQRFIDDAAHELRTPAAVVRAHLDVARHEAAGSAVAATLAVASGAVDRLAHVIESMLTLARIDAQSPAILRFRLDELLDETLDDFAHLASQAEITLEGGPWPATTIPADPEQVRRLLANLLDNAIRHTPAGGIVTLGCDQTAEGVAIRVRDTGAGIDANAVGRVFDRFYRGMPTRERYRGSGLGLAIAHAIAVGHGGRLTVESTPGEGSVFTVLLPGDHGRSPARG